MPKATNGILSNRLKFGVASSMLLMGVAPAIGADCRFVNMGIAGAEPRLVVDGTCTDPDFNAHSFVVESTSHMMLKVSPTLEIPYTEVKGYFPATTGPTDVAKGVGLAATRVRHAVTWRFPDKARWQHRFFQNVYPVGGGAPDPVFAFTHGGYTVAIVPGTPSVGYRVDAAAAQLAKAYADKLYGNSGHIYGYIYGVSGGSVQTMGAVEGTTGIWDGAVPISLATHSLNVHSFPWDGLYALAVPAEKRAKIAAAVAPGSNVDIYAGLTADEHAVLDELLNAGFSRKALENNGFNIAMTTILASGLPEADPRYEEDFWTRPGYEGANPPAWLTAAKVDGFATIAAINRDDRGAPTSIVFDRATIPAFGSIGAAGLQFYVYGADGKRVVGPTGGSLIGNLRDNILTLTTPVREGVIPAGPPNDPALLAALGVGAKVRINNRFLLAVCFYPRHTILNNGNPGYRQYRKADGTPKYVQRPVTIADGATSRTTGGLIEQGRINFKTIVIENSVDPSSYPYVASFYFSQIQKALGPTKARQMARIYYNDNADHASFGGIRGSDAGMLVGFGGIVDQALLDLAAWVEKGVAPPASTRFSIDAMNQLVLPAKAAERRGLQPVVALAANGKQRIEVGVGQPVTLTGRIEMPPGQGKILQYDWYLGDKPVAYETPTILAEPKPAVDVSRNVTFSKPGDYLVTLRTAGQRDGLTDNTTMLQNLARVRVVVR